MYRAAEYPVLRQLGIVVGFRIVKASDQYLVLELWWVMDIVGWYVWWILGGHGRCQNSDIWQKRVNRNGFPGVGIMGSHHQILSFLATTLGPPIHYGILQLSHVTSDCVFLDLFLPFPLDFATFLVQAARANSAVFVHLSLITWCWASSMMKAIRSLSDIPLDMLPESLLALSTTVMAWRVGWYKSGKDNMIIILKRVLAMTEPIFNKLSHHCIMS